MAAAELARAQCRQAAAAPELLGSNSTSPDPSFGAFAIDLHFVWGSPRPNCGEVQSDDVGSDAGADELHIATSRFAAARADALFSFFHHSAPQLSMRVVESTAETPRSRSVLRAWPAMLASAAVVLVLRSWIARHAKLGLVDDAYISLRYARNWASGRGLVYNPGEWVEGYSNFSYVVLETLLWIGGVADERAAWWPSTLALILVAPLLVGMVVSLGVRSRIHACLIACAIALEPSSVVWSRAGLEGPLFTWLSLAALACALRQPATRASVAACGGVCLIAAATRPEGIVLVPLCALTIARDRSALRRALGFSIACACVYAIGLLARHHVYGAWLPNTYYAKLDGAGRQLVQRGLDYAGSGLILQLPMHLLALTTLFLFASGRLADQRWLRVTFAWLAVLFAITIWEGGDFFPMYRFLSTSFALVALCALGPWLKIVARRGERSLLARVALAGYLVAISFGWVTFWCVPWPARTHADAFALEVTRARRWLDAGKALAADSPPDAVIGALAIGGIGFGSERRILDAVGLVDSHIAHVQKTLGAGLAGHEKFDNEYFFRRHPDAIILPPEALDIRLPRSWIQTVVKGPVFDALLRDARLEKDYELVYVPVPPNYWLHTFIRRDALPRWQLPAGSSVAASLTAAQRTLPLMAAAPNRSAIQGEQGNRPSPDH